MITVHVPLNKATRGIVNADNVGKLKPGVMLVNVARGGVYDEAAVAQALADGKIAGAGFDVYDPEPPVDSPILTAPNVTLTPHLGALTAEAQLRVAEEACEQVVDVLAGRSARYAVNAPLLTPETARAIAPYLPLTEILGRFAAQYLRGGVKTLTVDVAGDLADLRRLAADRCRAARRPGRRHERTRQPHQRRLPGQEPRPDGQRAQVQRRRIVRLAGHSHRSRATRARWSWPARSPTASRASSASTTTGSTWRRRP